MGGKVARVVTFAADRLVHVYGDSENADFIQALREIARESDDTADWCGCTDHDQEGCHVNGVCGELIGH